MERQKSGIQRDWGQTPTAIRDIDSKDFITLRAAGSDPNLPSPNFPLPAGAPSPEERRCCRARARDSARVAAPAAVVANSAFDGSVVGGRGTSARYARERRSVSFVDAAVGDVS